MLAWRRVVGLALLTGFLFCWTIPVLWGAVTSFKNDRDVLNYPPIGPFHPTLSNYVNVMSGDGSIVPNLQSSAILSVAATLVTLVLAIPAAYALARLKMPAKKPLGFYVLATQMLPPIGLVIPYFLIFSRFGLLNT
jgi:multiple sugar transport system permease protein/sorbitol/mannitol transport system permease protein